MTLIACDKFKGTLTAKEVRDILVAAIPGARGFLLADGGDGMLDALEAVGWTAQELDVDGPTGEPVGSRIVRAPAEAGAIPAEFRGAVGIEMADLCGILRLPGGELAPLDAHSTGLGQAIRAAEGATHLVIGVGGSASNDGGTGLLVGLGARLLDADGAEVPAGARNLHRIRRLDLSGVPEWVRTVRITLAADVDAPLVGEWGAVRVFGPQKGLHGAESDRVEEAMAQWGRVLAEATGKDPAEVIDAPGAGAAGGVGAALLALTQARREPGIDVIARVTGFADALGRANLVVTGEGSLDAQTLMGKTVAGVARLAGQADVPVVAVCGRSTLTFEETQALGVRRVYALTDIATSPEESMTRAGELLAQVGKQIAEEETPSPLLVGLTGGIASGKSTVAKQLVERGAVIVDSDQLAREVVEPGSPGLTAVADRFGDGILTEDGALDRAALGAIVFRDEQARRDLEAITHPRIADLRDRRTREAAEAGARVVVHDVPLLVEKNMAHLYDLVMVVHAPKEERVTRMVRERGMTEEAARARIAAQATKKQRRAVADLWVDNTGASDDLRAAVDALWDGPIADALSGLSRNR